MRRSPGGVLSFRDARLAFDDIMSLIRSSALTGFVSLVRELGGDPDDMLRRVRLKQRTLAIQPAVIPYATVVRLLDMAAEELDCEDFGLQLAQRQDLEILGPIALIARNSATVGEALQSIRRFMSSYSPAVAIGLEPVGGSEACVTFDLTDPKIPRRRQTIELSLGVMCNTIRLLTRQGFVPQAVLFRHARDMPAVRYRKYFGAEVRFEQPSDALLIRSSYLDLPMDHADTALRDVIADYVGQALSQRSLAISDQVVVLVERLLPTLRCDLPSVADGLSLHARTLQRRLAAESLNFEDLVDGVRRSRAEAYLAERSMPMSHVASMLGYAEQSSFNRACLRWFGTTPGERRRALQRRPRHRSPHRASETRRSKATRRTSGH
jgi:AraC-like DNA-binding protein